MHFCRPKVQDLRDDGVLRGCFSKTPVHIVLYFPAWCLSIKVLTVQLCQLLALCVSVCISVTRCNESMSSCSDMQTSECYFYLNPTHGSLVGNR